MEINYKERKCIICPQFICILYILIYIFLIIYEYTKKNFEYQTILLFPVIIYTTIFYFINNGIINKNFNKFKMGIMLSLYFAIGSFVTKFFGYFLIILLFLGLDFSDDDEDDDLIRKSVKKSISYIFFNDIILIMLVTSSIDFLFSWFLFIFKNQVKKFCENQPYDQNEFTNFPLIV